MPVMLEVSVSANFGESSTCSTIDGTPPKPVSRSASMRCSARSGSHLRMMVILLPALVPPTREAWQPVAWKSGTDSSGAACWLCWAISASRSMPERNAVRAAAKRMPSGEPAMLRCVPSTPLGRPVVPLV